MTATEMKVYIESKTNQKLSIDKFSKELKRLGFVQKIEKWGKNSTRRIYGVSKSNTEQNNISSPDNLPF